MLSELSEDKRESSEECMTAWRLYQQAVQNANALFDGQYAQGKIYQICHHDELLYVGSTCKTIEQRIVGHVNDKQRCDRPFYRYLRENELEFDEDLTVDVVEFFPCSSRKELEGRETEYIQHLQPRFNINGQRRPESAVPDAETLANRKRDNEKHFIDELLQGITPDVQTSIMHLYTSDRAFRRTFLAVLLEIQGSDLSEDTWKALEGLCPKPLDRARYIEQTHAVKRLCTLIGLQNSFDTTVSITRQRLEDNAEEIASVLDDLQLQGIKQRARPTKEHFPHTLLKLRISSALHCTWSGSMLRGEGLPENVYVDGKRTKMQTRFVIERESTYLNTCLAVLTE